MKIAVLSDIHSNQVALEECINFINKINIYGVIFLGDNISDCPNPRGVLDIIKHIDEKYKTWHINGNREEYFLDYNDKKTTWTKSSNKGSLLYTYEHLNKEDINIIRSRSNQMTVRIEGKSPIRICHGSPYKTRELLYSEKDNTNKCLENIEEDYLLCGHSHYQFTYNYKGKILINPGSVGVAMGVTEAAHFAILEWDDSTNKWNYELITVPYNFQKLKELFMQSSLMSKAYCLYKGVKTLAFRRNL